MDFSGTALLMTHESFLLLALLLLPATVAAQSSVNQTIEDIRFQFPMKSFLQLLALLLLAAPASAQINTLNTDNPRENARLKLGPLYVTPRILLNEFGVDTNVFNQAGEVKKDFTFTLAPSATVWLPIARRGLIKSTAGTDLVWYREFASERSVDPSVTVRGEGYLRRFTFFAEDAFTHSRQRPTFEIDIRSRRLENRVTAGVDMRLTPKLSLEVHGAASTTRFDGDSEVLGTRLAETLNRDSTGFGVVSRYRLSVLTAVALRAERFEDRFKLSPGRDTDNVRIMPGVEIQPKALISGSAYVGVRHLNPVDETSLPEFAGVVSSLALSYTLLGSTTIGVSQTRDINYSYEPLQPYYVASGAGIRGRRALGPRFDVVLSADRHTYAYRDLIVQGIAPEPERIDTIGSYGGSFGYRLGREGRVGLGLTYWKRDSTTRPGREYDGLRIGTTATYGF